MANTDKVANNLNVTAKKKNIFKNKKFWIWMAIGIVLLLVVIKFSGSKTSAKSVALSEVSSKDIVQSISVSGNIDAEQDDKVLLNTTQKVVDVMVKEGQDVKKGTQLVKLDTTDLEYQLQRAQVNLNATRENYVNGKKTTEDALTQAEVGFQKAQGDYDQIKRKFDANQVLLDGGYISKDEYETSKKQLSDSENQLKISELQLETAKKNLSSYSSSSQLKQQLDLYEAELDNINKKIAESTVTANIDGRVVRLDAEKGEYPKADKNTIEICDISSYKLLVGLSQYDSARVKIGQKATIKVKGLSNKYNGTIVRIGEIASTVVDGTTKEAKINIEIKFDNPDQLIKVGYEADADIILEQKNGAVSAGFEAVKQDTNGKYVFVIDNGKAVKRYIKTGMETDFDIEVIDGLKVGDKYITSPNDTIKEGDMVVASVGNKK